MNRPQNRTAFDRLLLDLLPDLTAYTRAVTKDFHLADDVMSQAIYKMLRSWEQFDGRHFRAWAYRIVRNEHLDQRKSIRRRGTTGFDDIEPVTLQHAVAQEPRQDTLIELHEMLAQIDALSPNHRQILVDICLLGESYEGMAERKGVPVNTIKSQIWRARDSLQRRLNDSVV